MKPVLSILFVCFLLPTPSFADFDFARASAVANNLDLICDDSVPQQDCEMVRDVATRILAVADPIAGYMWPPLIAVKDGPLDAFAWSGSYETYQQAFARECDKNQCIGYDPGPPAEGELFTVMVFSTGLLNAVVEGEADRLALVLGHELGHITNEHSSKGRARRKAEETVFVDAAYGRTEELEADLHGYKVALGAGYSYKKILRGFSRFIDKDISNYNSFHALNSDHPSWKDRLAYIDERQSELWSAMSAFDSGVLFLMTEQYASAERAFLEVTKNFPSSYEAWANHGYALLMLYCDALEANDVRSFDIGHILVGGFYRRPESLEAAVRGIDEELWWDAIGSLKEAIRLHPNSTLAIANLGVAYLLRPAGKDVGQAVRYLEEAAALAETDTSLDAMTRAAVLINAGVAVVAGGSIAEATAQFDHAETIGNSLSSRGSMPANVETALMYNRAFIFARADRASESLEMFEQYLAKASPSSAWWTLAYERYAEVAKAAGVVPTAKIVMESRANPDFRGFSSVEFAGGGVSLGEELDDVEARIGMGSSIPLAGRGKISRVVYADLGIELLATQKVIAIALSGPNAPSLNLTTVGLGSSSEGQLSIGMSRDEIDVIFENESYDFKNLDDNETRYRFYRDLGLAIRIKGGIVQEIIVAQIPAE